MAAVAARHVGGGAARQGGASGRVRGCAGRGKLAASQPRAEQAQEVGQQQGAAEAKAVRSRVRMAPNKVRRVLNTIRGRDYEECLMVLEFMRYRACEPVLKALISAGANAKHNHGMNKARLYVSECFADEGPALKRGEPRAMGQAFPYRKRQCHITIKLQEKPQ